MEEERRHGMTEIREQMEREFDSVRAEMEDIRKSMGASLKWAIGIVAIPFIFWLVSWGVLTNTVATHSENITSVQESIKDVTSRQQTSDVTMAEIRTQLANINVTLLEIKSKLK